MSCRKRNSSRYRLTICAAALLLAAASCGGPYKARRLSMPDQKLRLADDYFGSGKFDRAAVEYKDFLASFAGDERSDYVQFRLAESYRLDEDYALAAVEYRILINDYGYSEYVDDAFFLEGLCSFRQTPRPERDQGKAYEALSRVNRFLHLFPNSPRRDEAIEMRSEIHDHLGMKEFMNAKMYFSMKIFEGARIYFDKIVGQYAGTVWADRSHYYLGRIHEREDRIDQAIEEYGRVTASAREIDEKKDAQQRLAALSGGASDGK